MDYCNSLLAIHYGTLFDPFLAKLVFLNPTLKSTDCLKQLHWLPIHNHMIFKVALLTYRTLATSNPPISIAAFSAATHLIFVHLPSFNYANLSTSHPYDRLLICLLCCLERSTSPRKSSNISFFSSKNHLKIHLFRMKPGQRRHKVHLTLCVWRLTN